MKPEHGTDELLFCSRTKQVKFKNLLKEFCLAEKKIWKFLGKALQSEILVKQVESSFHTTSVCRMCDQNLTQHPDTREHLEI